MPKKRIDGRIRDKSGDGPWIDVSVPIQPGMPHWPDSPPVRVQRAQSIARGDAANVSMLQMSAHTGTHMDAPAHFLRHGRGMESWPITGTVGAARIIEIRGTRAVTVDELRSHRIRRGERILLKTRNSARPWFKEDFRQSYVYVSKDGAVYLAERGIRCVGIDYLSVAGFGKDAVTTHQTLLKAGIWIVEGLYLSKVDAGRYDLVCLPLDIVGADGAPARAIVRPRRRS